MENGGEMLFIVYRGYGPKKVKKFLEKMEKYGECLLSL